MPSHEIMPASGREDELLEEFASLSARCADGYDTMMDALKQREPSINDRQGLIDDRHEVYAVPLPDCQEWVMIVSIDRKDQAAPRTLHGAIMAYPAVMLGTRAKHRVFRSFGLTKSVWEGKP